MFLNTGISLLGAQPTGGGGLPDIETNGLVLWLDADIAASNPGSGTTWFDLSGAGVTNANLIEGATFGTNAYGGVVNIPTKAASAISDIYNYDRAANTTGQYNLYEYGWFVIYNMDNITSGYSAILGDMCIGSSGDLTQFGATQTQIVGHGGSYGYTRNFGTTPPTDQVASAAIGFCLSQSGNQTYQRVWYNGSLEFERIIVGGTTAARPLTQFRLGSKYVPTSNGMTGDYYVACLYQGEITQAIIDKNIAAYASRYGL